MTAAVVHVKDEIATPVVRADASYADLMNLAKELVTTGFLPQAVKTPAQAVAIILTGKELGLGPMQSLRSISIIQGKPELAADLQLSLFHRDGGRSKWETLSDTEAVLWLKHPNGDEHTETFSMVDAKRAGISGGQNWQKYPKAMLRSRAITAGLKSVGFEPLTGVYAPGEIGGPEVVEGQAGERGEVQHLPDEPSVGLRRPAPETTGGDVSAASPAPKGFNVDGEPIMVCEKRKGRNYKYADKPLTEVPEDHVLNAIYWARTQSGYEAWVGAAEAVLEERRKRDQVVATQPLDQPPIGLTEAEAAERRFEKELAKREAQ